MRVIARTHALKTAHDTLVRRNSGWLLQLVRVVSITVRTLIEVNDEAREHVVKRWSVPTPCVPRMLYVSISSCMYLLVEDLCCKPE